MPEIDQPDNRKILRVNMAMTLDGRVMRPDGRWYGLTSAEDRARMDRIRMGVDALILGKNSISMDDPVVIPRGASASPDQIPRPVILCRNSLPPADRKVFVAGGKKPLLIISTPLAGKLGPLAEYCEAVVCSDPELAPTAALEILHERGLTNLLLEGGPRLNHSFFHADLVDELYLTLVPYLIGQRNLPAIVDGADSFPHFDRLRWECSATETVQNEVFLHYRRIRRRERPG